MVTERELIARVHTAFSITGKGSSSWPDPHPHRNPRDEEYSRVSDPSKWRIIGERADAWLVALVETGLASVDTTTPIPWRRSPGTDLLRSALIVPHAPTALPLIIARSRIGTVDDAGVTLGVGVPAVCIGWIPDCGCDACDSGSQDVLDELDSLILRVVSGESWRVWFSGAREIVVVGDEGAMQTSGVFGSGEVQSLLDDPSCWYDYSGTSWITGQ